MWPTFAQFAGVLVSALALGFAVFTQVRQSSQRKYAERAETAMRLLASLEEIDVGGISPKLEGSLALELHNKQVHGLREVVRINIAEFEMRAKRTGFSLIFHSLVGFYGILVLVIAFSYSGQIAHIQADQRWIGVWIAVAIFALGGVMTLDLVMAMARRTRARKARQKAGIYVPSSLAILSTLYNAPVFWLRRRRVGRRRSGPKLPARD